MIPRRIEHGILEALGRQAAVAIVGPRQVGKTTLALQIAQQRPSLYLDLESAEDRFKLEEPLLFLRNYEECLVILDEIHRVPELFQSLRVLIDEGRRRGRPNGRFLILGSASVDLLRQSGESLAGRIEYVEMGTLDVLEVGADATTKLWVRGGFPGSYLCSTERDSYTFRRSFIRTYLERDVAQFGIRVPAETLARFWTMLAHNQGCMLNASKMAAGLSVSAPTVTSYVDLLADLLLARRLAPYHANVGKRLVRSPKVYIRDSGLLHALLGLTDHNDISGHPVVGASWEGFVIENILASTPEGTSASFYRTAAGAEIDLLLEFPGGRQRWAIEIKRASAPKAEKGFHLGCDDVRATRKFVVNSGSDRYPSASEVEVIGVHRFAELLNDLKH